MNLSFSIQCPQCGSDQFIQPENANLESQVTCSSCGLTGVVKNLAKPQAMDETKRFAIEAIRAAFRK